MTAAAQHELARYAQRLSHGDEPVSFYDAFQLVKRARACREHDARLLAVLAELYAAPAVTDGAKRVLAEFLRATLKIQAQERALAARVIKRADSGKTVRAKVGQTLKLGVLDAGQHEATWRCTLLQGAAELTACSPARAAETGAQLELQLTQPGVVLLELALPPSGGRLRQAAMGGSSPTFKLRVIVERG